MKKVLLFLSLGLISTFATAQLSGTYTINAASGTGGTNYQSFTAAYAALTSQGVNGPVTFNVIQGTYTNQTLYIANISGASSTNTITFQAAATNTNEVLWTNSSYHMYLYSTSSSFAVGYMSFEGIHFESTGSSMMFYFYGTTSSAYSQVIYDLEFHDCVFDRAIVSSTSTAYGFLINYYCVQNGLVVDGCEFNGGSSPLYLYYPYQTGSKHTITNNSFNDFAYYGLYDYAYDPSGAGVDLIYSGNYLNNANTAYYYGYATYIYRPGQGSVISDNELHLGGQYYSIGIYLYYANYNQGSSATPVECYNNAIKTYNPTPNYYQYGLYFPYCNNLLAYHNSVFLATTTSYTSFAAYTYSSSTTYGNNEFKNNILQTSSTSSYLLYTYTTSTTASTWDFDYNVYHGPNDSWYSYHSGTVYSDFSAWQNASGEDDNSAIIDPNYETTQLIPQNADVNNFGTPLGVTTDIDGNSRSTTVPDPGAYEFSVPQNNAQPTVLHNPSNPVCDNDTSIVITLKNAGLVTLTTCSLHYDLNGTVTNMLWSGSLAPQADTVVTVNGNTSFSDGDELTVWTSLPNGVVDSSAANDTLNTTLWEGLSGTYGIPADYATLNDAADALSERGVCGHVVFNIASGTYNEQVTFNDIPGTSSDATVTFQSASGNANDVMITAAGNSTSNMHVIKLDGADWMRFNEVTVENTGTSYCVDFEIMSNSNFNNIEDCELLGPANQTSSYCNRIRMYQAITEGNSFRNNHLTGGGYAMYIYGSGSTARGNDVVIQGNHFDNIYYYNLLVYYYDNVLIDGNILRNDVSGYSSYQYGMYIYYSDGIQVTRNYIGSTIGAGYYYKLTMQYCNGTFSDPIRVANNCIMGGNPASASSSGYPDLYLNQCGFVNVDNNTMNHFGGGTYNSCLYVNGGGLIKIRNNSFSNFFNGPALLNASPYAVTESDNNNFYSSGNELVNFSNTGYSTLEDYQDAIGYDMYSISEELEFEDTLTCKTCNDMLDGAGTSATSASVDIDSASRSAETPDIGAVEFLAAGNFSLGPDSTYCGNEITIEAGGATSVSWNVNSQSSTGTSVTLSASGQPETFNVLVNIVTEFCGNAFDEASITLVPDASMDSTEHICADETATLNPGGGGTATYQWSTGETTATIDVAEPGTYTVVKDELGCESASTIAVTQSDAVEIADVEACSDELPVQLDATITDGTSYAWSGGTNLSDALNSFSDAGAYSVTATDVHGCSSSSSFNLAVFEEPEADITETHTGTAFFFDASTSVYIGSNTTYFWDFGYNGVTSTNISETMVYPWSNCEVTYTVSLTIDNGCGVDVKTMSITPCPLGVEELAEGTFAIYPNPANDVVNFALANAAQDQGIVEVLDLTGRTVLTQTVDAGTSIGELNVSSLAAGSYSVKVSVDGYSSLNTLIKQ